MIIRAYPTSVFNRRDYLQFRAQTFCGEAMTSIM